MRTSGWLRADRGLRAERLTLLGVAVAVVAMLTLAPVSAAPVLPVLAGCLLLLAWLLLRLEWLLRPSPQLTWVTTAVSLAGASVLAVSVPVLVPTMATPAPGSTEMVHLLICAAGAVLVLVGLRTEHNPDPLVAGAVAGGLSYVALVWAGLLPAVLWPRAALVGAWGLVVLLYVMAAMTIARDRRLPRETRGTAATVVLALGAAQTATVRGDWMSAVVGGEYLTVGAGLLAVAVSFRRLWSTLDAREQSSSSLETRVVELEGTTRREAERLHELRSTVAGISAAARLLQDPATQGDTKAQLQQTMCAEIDRLNRLIGAERTPDPTRPRSVVDVGTALHPVVESHRLRGRVVEWESTGSARARARTDDVAEVVNILLDNAHKHTGGAASRVEVSEDDEGVAIAVTDSGPGIQPDVREHLFDWGARGPASSGQGIGLHVAHRLVHEQGGSLSLADGAGPGASFLIRLPSSPNGQETHGVGRHEQVQ